jgi:transposase-like protein
MKKDLRNLIDLVEFFRTEEICVKYLKSTLWIDGAKCPHCGSKEAMEYKSNCKRNRCKECKKDFSIRQGAIFEDSNIPLKNGLWLCIFLMHTRKVLALAN